MESKEQKTKIDGVTFQVAPFTAIEGLRLKAYLIRTFGPALGEIVGSLDGKKALNIMDIPIEGEGIAKGLEKLFEQLDEENFVALVERLFANVIAHWNEDGKNRSIAFNRDFETSLNLVFQGKLFSIYPLIVFVLKVNYPDFFLKVVGGIGKKMRTTPTYGTEERIPENESAQSATSED